MDVIVPMGGYDHCHGGGVDVDVGVDVIGW